MYLSNSKSLSARAPKSQSLPLSTAAETKITNRDEGAIGLRGTARFLFQDFDQRYPTRQHLIEVESVSADKVGLTAACKRLQPIERKARVIVPAIAAVLHASRPHTKLRNPRSSSPMPGKAGQCAVLDVIVLLATSAALNPNYPSAPAKRLFRSREQGQGVVQDS